jgi:hypothetical protein
LLASRSPFVVFDDGDAVVWGEGVEGDVPWASVMSSDLIVKDIMK